MSNDLKKKLKLEKYKMKKLKEIAKEFKIEFKDISYKEKEFQDINYISLNVKEKMKVKTLPQKLAKYFKDFTKYIELGNYFFSELDTDREIPYFFLFKKKNKDNNYCYLIFKDNNETKKINLDNGKKFDPDDLEDYINEQINGNLICHYMKLIK